LSTHAFDTKVQSREMWARPPHKKALDQMWYAGDLATCYREAFVKYYNLGERVFPAHLKEGPDDQTQVNMLCDQALDKISFGTAGEVQRYWEAMSAQTCRGWLERRVRVPVTVQASDESWYEAWAAPDIEERVASAPEATIRLRIVNPFDPTIRDRMRLQKLFGFEYRNEMFVPQARRRWGYYVYPLLEGDRFVGRCEIKADRAAGWLRVTGFWPEPKVRWGAARLEKLEAELQRFARMVGIRDVDWDVARPV
jgi:uncharacterized protein YcaQ